MLLFRPRTSHIGTLSRNIVTNHKPSYQESQLNRSFFLTILAATATKRDAKAYIEKYQRPYTSADRIVVKHTQTLQEFFESEDGAYIDVEPSLAKTSPIRAALVLIRDLVETSTSQLLKICYTLGQLHRLGLQPIVIVDTHLDEKATGHGVQVNRLAQILESMDIQARPIQEGLFAVHNPLSMHTKRIVSIYDTRILKAPVIRRQVPVIRTIATDSTGKKRSITADSAMKAICQTFGCDSPSVPHQRDLNRSAIMIDKLIILDAIGGIHSPTRREGSHVFINLDQENLALQRELAELASPDVATKHLRNLDTCRICLGLLSDHASAMITTPKIAGSEAGQAHPLIHNLLTDKPMFSPSLPVLGPRTPSTSTTILRKGVDVKIYRNVDLPSPSIDLKKLERLINDSFARSLDVPRYLARTKGHIDALIIAGDYDGAAIITSEIGRTTTHQQQQQPEHVPYLDKFAVLRKKQGAGGVADILFNAMMKLYPDELTWRSRNSNPVNKWYFERAKGTLLLPPTAPSLPGTETPSWRLFWTTPQIRDWQRFQDYIEVARKIEPTWLD